MGDYAYFKYITSSDEKLCHTGVLTNNITVIQGMTDDSTIIIHQQEKADGWHVIRMKEQFLLDGK